jgi:hypothetical protein
MNLLLSLSYINKQIKMNPMENLLPWYSPTLLLGFIQAALLSCHIVSQILFIAMLTCLSSHILKPHDQTVNMRNR